MATKFQLLHFIYCRPFPCPNFKEHSQQHIRISFKGACWALNILSQRKMLSYQKLLPYPVLYPAFCSSIPTSVCDLIVHASPYGPELSIPLVYKLFFSRVEILCPHKAMLRFVMLNLMCELGRLWCQLSGQMPV